MRMRQNIILYQKVIIESMLIDKYVKSTKIPIDRQINWDFFNKPHGLVSGITGGGKSYFAMYLFYQLLMRGEVRVIDPKHADLWQAGKIVLGEKDSVFQPNQVCRLLRETCDEINRRYERISSANRLGTSYLNLGLRPLTVIFDEYAAFFASVSQDRKIKEEVDKYMKKIILTGRQAGCYIIILMQKPLAEIISTDIRDQLGMRVTLGNMDDSGYKIIFGQNDGFSYQYRPSGTGYIFIPGEGYQVPQQFDAPYISDLQELVERMMTIVKA